MQNKLKQAMIFSAGVGTRLAPISNTIPKALLPVNGVPLIEQVILKLKDEGIERIVINVHHFTEKIKDYIEDKQNFALDIIFSDETEKLFDTGGGLLKAKNMFIPSEPILLYNVDILSNLNISDMYNYHNINNALATLAVRNRITSRYLEFSNRLELIGRYIIGDDVENNESFIEHNPNIFGFSGIHIISPEIFDYINESGTFSIIDLYTRLCKNNRIIGYRHNADWWMDCGTYSKIKHLL